MARNVEGDPKGTARFSRASLNDRQVSEIIGLARGLLADGQLSDIEVQYLFKWLAASDAAVENPMIAMLFNRLENVMADGVVDDDERSEIISTLNMLCGDTFEIGEMLKATSLPLCTPPPEIAFLGKRFTFTGTFAFGSRKECHQAVVERGASTANNVSAKVDFLVIGEYATDAWKQSTWGRKVERAADLRGNGNPIAIVSEAHWRSFLLSPLAR